MKLSSAKKIIDNLSRDLKSRLENEIAAHFGRRRPLTKDLDDRYVMLEREEEDLEYILKIFYSIRSKKSRGYFFTN